MVADDITGPERSIQGAVAGREFTWTYSPEWVAEALLGLRLVMGWVFLQAGIEKIVDPTWTAAGYLRFAVHENNPFRDAFVDMAGSGLVDGLVIWGLTLIGLALLTGTLVRFAAFWGAIMMAFFWASALQGGLLAGLPLEHGWVVDDHVVYAVLLFGLGALGAGRILGVDAWLEETAPVRDRPWLRLLLG